MKKGKQYHEMLAKVDRAKRYSLEEAVQLVKDTSYTKFDATVEIADRKSVV